MSDFVKQNNQFFRFWSKYYDLMCNIIYKLRNEVVKLLDGEKLNIIDVACGTGTLSVEIAKAGHKVIGIDVCPDMLKKAKKKVKPNYNLKFIKADATKLPFFENQFDVATISLALHDMPKEIIIKVLAQTKKVIKPDGKIIIVEYYTPQNFIGKKIVSLWETEYYQNFTKTGLDHYLQKVDLRKTKTKKYWFNNFQIVECKSGLNQVEDR